MSNKTINSLMQLLEAGTHTLEDALLEVDGVYNSLSGYERSLVKVATSLVNEANGLQNVVAEINKEWDEVGANQLFDEERLRRIRHKANKFSYGSPLAVAIIGTYQLLVHSGNRKIKASNDDIDKVIQDFVQLNNVAVFDYLARISKERKLWTDSRLFFAYFTSESVDEVKVRFTPSEEITDIIYNPNDNSEVWLYCREYTQVNLDGTTKAIVDIHPNVDFIFDIDTQASIEVALRSKAAISNFNWDIPIKSIVVNDGVPRLYPALSWIHCYENLLNMVATVYSAISAVALVTQTKAEYVKKVSHEIGKIKHAKDNKGRVGNLANNVVLEGDIKTLNAKSALLTSTDLDVFLYQISMVVNLPPHAFGRAEPATGLSDGQNSNEIMRLAIEAEQRIWEDLERGHINYRLIQAVERGDLSGLGTVKEIPVGEGITVQRIVWNDDIDGSYNVIYPPVRNQDIKAMIEARISAHTLDDKIPNPDISTPKEYYADVMPLIGRMDITERLDSVPDEWTVAPIPTDKGLPTTENYAIQAITGLASELKEALEGTDEAKLGELVVNYIKEGRNLHFTEDGIELEGNTININNQKFDNVETFLQKNNNQ